MRKISVNNSTRGASLARDGRVADTMWTRLKGVIGSELLAPGEGLLIVPCHSMQTHFLGFPIDVVYVDGDNRVAGLHHRLPTSRFRSLHTRGRVVLELRVGTLAAGRRQEGHRLRLKGAEV